YSIGAQAIIAFGFVVAISLLARGYMASVSDPELMVVRRAEVVTMLPRPVSYILSRTGSSETGWFYERVNIPMKHEQIMFVGFIPWLAVAMLLITARTGNHRPGVMSAVLAMLAVIGMTLYLNGYSLYFLLMKLPGVNAIRGVSRVIMIL